MSWIPPAHSPFEAHHAWEALGADSDAVAALEAELASTFRAEAVVPTASGTHALQLALRSALATVEPDRRVVALPAYSCFDLVSAALAVGAAVAFYDVDPNMLAPAPESLERAVRQGAGVIVAANLFGQPLDWAFLRGLRDGHGVVLIEDAAQGIGSTWEGRSAGEFGDYTVLSFARGKGWTGGGGGALLARGPHEVKANDLEPSPGARAGLYLRALAQWALTRPSLYGLPARLPFLGLGETHFREPTREAAIHPFQAALVLASRHLARLEVAHRRDAAARLKMEIQGARGLIFPVSVPGGSPGWLRLPVRIEGGIDVVPRALMRLGVHRGYPRVLPDLPAASRLTGAGPCAVPGARTLVHELVTVPTHSRAPIERLLEELPGAFRAAWRR